MYTLIKHVKADPVRRAAFNQLAVHIFDLDFEPWYQNGFWNEMYIPYTFFDGHKAIANVSVNRMDFELEGQLKHYLQLGTIMTDPAYRGQGLIRRLMEEIQKDFPNHDGIFLFANETVLDLYPRFGFTKALEYQYSMKTDNHSRQTLIKVPMNTREDWNRMKEIITGSTSNGLLYMRNPDLDMFYLSQFMTGQVYYSKALDAYAVIEFSDDRQTADAVIWDIFASEKTDPRQLAAELGSGIKTVTLAFTPEKADGYEISPWKDEDLTLFMKGGIIEDLKGKKIRFPGLAHA